MTIRDNIAYPDSTGNITDKEVIKAARLANIHEYIISLPKVRNYCFLNRLASWREVLSTINLATINMFKKCIVFQERIKTVYIAKSAYATKFTPYFMIQMNQ